MLFNSLEFLIFLPVVFILFWAVPKRFKWLVLLVASYFFYMYWNWKLVFLIVFTTVISYSCGLLLEKYSDKVKVKRAVVALTLISCIGILLFFKYFNFFFEIYRDIVKAFKGNSPNGFFSILLPVGISFYTFQTASYVIDVYKGDIKAERHFGYYALFVSFFPQLVAGPIERPNDLIPQLKAEKSIKKIDYISAFRIMLIGFFKKIAVADVIGIFVNAVYEDVASANGPMVIVATFLFAFQIFCDFSGYSDIAVGCAKLFGVNLTENFKKPYLSKNIKDFWNRWHISLSKWLRDYIYFPLGGSRVKKWRWAVNVLIVFFVSGLWHGASYNFVIWGILHGVFQIIGVLTLKYRNLAWAKMRVNPEGKAVTVLRVIGTFILVDFCWIFFRANTIGDAGLAIAKIFTDWSFTKAAVDNGMKIFGFGAFSIIYVILCIASLYGVDALKTVSESNSKILKSGAVRYIIYIVMALCIICSWVYLQATDVGSSFIYFQF